MSDGDVGADAGGPAKDVMTRAKFRREAEALEARLRSLGTRARAEGAKAYLKSDLAFAGNDTASLRREVKAWRQAHPALAFDALLGFAEALWQRRVFELRIFACELIVARARELTVEHLAFLERLVRDSHTWALVDVIAPRLVGALLERAPGETGRELDRWARDDDFWVRRAALLALLLPMRRGSGDWRRFRRYADPLVDDREFFIRKAIGWLLREAASRQPAQVVAFVRPRVHRLSGVTWREAVRKLPASDRHRLEELRMKSSERRESSTTPGEGRSPRSGRRSARG
ncbi:MAG: DNA alkylation repair protein [Vicinamibacterales bacterium]